jgi:hypothetical protein
MRPTLPKLTGRTRRIGHVHLQGIGSCPAIRASELKDTMVRLYNYGGTGVITDVRVTDKWVTYKVYEGGDPNKVYTKRSKPDTLIPLSLGSWYLYSSDLLTKHVGLVKDRVREEVAAIEEHPSAPSTPHWSKRLTVLKAVLAADGKEAIALAKDAGMAKDEDVELLLEEVIA